MRQAPDKPTLLERGDLRGVFWLPALDPDPDPASEDLKAWRTATALREAALASWVGQNQIVELRFSETFPEVSEFNGEVDYANTRWRWQAVVSETGVEDLRRVDVEVSLVLDVSGSMGWGTKLPDMQAAAKDFIDEVLANNISLSASIDEAVEDTMCVPYPPPD